MYQYSILNENRTIYTALQPLYDLQNSIGLLEKHGLSFIKPKLKSSTLYRPQYSTGDA